MERLAATAAALLALVAVAVARQREPHVVLESTPATWFEHLTQAARVSPDGRWALTGRGAELSLVDLDRGVADDHALRGPFRVVDDAVFAGGGQVIRLADIDGHRGWRLDGTDTSLPLPAAAEPVLSPDGRRLAYVLPTNRAVVQVDATPHDLGAPVLQVQWTPDSERLVALTRRTDFNLTLCMLDPRSKSRRTVADGLDGDVYPARFAVASRRGRQVAVLGLVGPAPPDPATRHEPLANRDLDLWTVDLETGRAIPLVRRAGDDFAPSVAGGHLFWTRAHVRPSVVVVPIAGGRARELVAPGELPYWRPDGRQLAFTVGGWRLRGVALPLDVHVLDLDDRAHAMGGARPLITGYHEDFSPAWSPDGRWLAFHSHRSPTPVPSYAAPGSTDDVWIARADEPRGTEQRLTEFGHEAGMVDWAPDSRRLVFVTQDRDAPGTSRAWVVTIDPATGRRLDVRPLPVSSEIASAETVAWSPDGRTIAIESKQGSRRRALWLHTLADGTARHVTDLNAVTFGGVDWTPDGHGLVYGALAGERMQIFAIDLASGRSRQLTDDPHTSLFLPQVSPDGRFVAATAMRHTRQVLRLPWR